MFRPPCSRPASSPTCCWLSGKLPPEIAAQIRSGYPLLLAFGASNAIVALVINPWRHDRIPDRFPNIVQDAIVIGLFAVAATIFLPEKIAATTAVGAVVIGFALQDTLGNLFSGLAIQVEKPFHVGQWVTIGGKDGKVAEITWRATKIRTKTGNFVVVPEQRAVARHHHQLFGAQRRDQNRDRSRRQLRYAAQRRQDGDPRGAARRADAGGQPPARCAGRRTSATRR